MSEEQDKEKLIEKNIQETKEAMKLAQEAIQRDREAGIPTNSAEVINNIANSIRGKLEREEFHVALDEEGNQVPPRPKKNE